MNELSSDARSLLARVRSAHEPRSGEQERVRKALAVRLAAGATLTASIATAAKVGATSTPGTIGGLLLVKAVGAGFLIGTIVVGVGVLSSDEVGQSAPARKVAGAPAPRAKPVRTEPRALPQPAPETVPQAAVPSLPTASGATLEKVEPPATMGPGAPQAPAPVRSDEPLAVNGGLVRASEAPGSSLASFPEAPVATPSSVRPEASVPAIVGEPLTAEARALAEVQRRLDQGSPAVALELLDRHSRQFATGALGQERAAARVFALCALGRRAEAQREGARFLATVPQSPLSARVRAACAEPGVAP